jgi:hypothetical protein
MGKQATKTVKTAKKLQTLLGEHQDSVVSAAFLRRLGAQAGVEMSHNGFTYGILLAKEWQQPRTSEVGSSGATVERGDGGTETCAWG